VKDGVEQGKVSQVCNEGHAVAATLVGNMMGACRRRLKNNMGAAMASSEAARRTMTSVSDIPYYGRARMR
jgi:hypothetical protein